MNSLRWLQLVWCSNFIKFRCCQWWLHQDYYNKNCNNWIWSWQEKQKSYYQFHNILIDVSIMRTNIILGFDEVDILFYLRLNFFLIFMVTFVFKFWIFNGPLTWSYTFRETQLEKNQILSFDSQINEPSLYDSARYYSRNIPPIPILSP